MAQIPTDKQVNLLLADTNALFKVSNPQNARLIIEHLGARLRTVSAVRRELSALTRNRRQQPSFIEALIINGSIPVIRTEPALVKHARAIQGQISPLRTSLHANDETNWAESVLIAQALIGGPTNVIWTDDRQAAALAVSLGVSVISTRQVLAMIGRPLENRQPLWETFCRTQNVNRDDTESRQLFEQACSNSQWKLTNRIDDRYSREPHGEIESRQVNPTKIYPDTDFILRVTNSGRPGAAFLDAARAQLVVSERMVRYIARHSLSNSRLGFFENSTTTPDVDRQTVTAIAGMLNKQQSKRPKLVEQPRDHETECEIDAELIAMALANSNSNNYGTTFDQHKEAALRIIGLDTCTPKSLFETIAAARPNLRPHLQLTFSRITHAQGGRLDRTYIHGRHAGLSVEAFRPASIDHGSVFEHSL